MADRSKEPSRKCHANLVRQIAEGHSTVFPKIHEAVRKVMPRASNIKVLGIALQVAKRRAFVGTWEYVSWESIPVDERLSDYDQMVACRYSLCKEKLKTIREATWRKNVAYYEQCKEEYERV